MTGGQDQVYFCLGDNNAPIVYPDAEKMRF